MAAGGGFKKFYSKFDAFFLRTVGYTTARIWSFLYFYDWINPDPRREARMDFYGYAAVAGGLVGGVLTNPTNLVFARMQVDEMYPKQARRNYSSFVDGFVKAAEEGALMRGSLANGLKLSGLVAGAGVYDYVKENMFYFFGPISLNRLVGTAAGVGTAMLLSMPFDTIATRMYTMRPLPNGEMPYKSTIDCYNKIFKYECSFDKHSNFGSFYSGGQAYFLRLYLIAIISQYMLDYYHASNKVSEFWAPARYSWATGIDYDIHNPYTDGFNMLMNTRVNAKGGAGYMHPDGKSNIKVI